MDSAFKTETEPELDVGDRKDLAAGRLERSFSRDTTTEYLRCP